MADIIAIFNQLTPEQKECFPNVKRAVSLNELSEIDQMTAQLREARLSMERCVKDLKELNRWLYA